MATTKGKERAHDDASKAVRRYPTRGTTEPETTTIRNTPEEGPSTHRDVDDESSELSELSEEDVGLSVQESIKREEKRIREIKDEIERRKALRAKEEAVRSRIGELEEAIRTRREFEEELRDILALQEEEGITEEEPPHKRRRANAEEDRLTEAPNPIRQPYDAPPSRIRPAPKIPKMPPYKGKNIQEAQTFIAGAERRFRQDNGYYYETDQAKIDFCVLAFETKPERSWTQYESEVGVGNTTWEEFKDFLFDSIIDKDNRILSAANRYEGARQRDGQSVDDFATYLDTLERELHITDDHHRQQALYAKLRIDLKKRINQCAEIPRTRKGFLALARRIENSEKENAILSRTESSSREPSGNAPRQNHQRPRFQGRGSRSDGNGSSKPPPGAISDANRTPVGGGSDSSRGGPRCYRCNSTSHPSRECPEVECYNCHEKGHISLNCTKPRRTGNGDARS